jgi:hypothetical protein
MTSITASVLPWRFERGAVGYLVLGLGSGENSQSMICNPAISLPLAGHDIPHVFADSATLNC